jgi:glycerophosphoryl diester phosphodiesterase
MTPVRLVQLVDANDVNPDGSLDFTAPFDRPYDWTVSKDPKLCARLFSFFVTDEGLREIRTYADGIGPWKRYIVSTAAVDLNGDGKIGDENGDGRVDEADRKLLPPTDLIRRAHRLGLLVHPWTFRNEPRRLRGHRGGRPGPAPARPGPALRPLLHREPRPARIPRLLRGLGGPKR